MAMATATAPYGMSSATTSVTHTAMAVPTRMPTGSGGLDATATAVTATAIEPQPYRYRRNHRSVDMHPTSVSRGAPARVGTSSLPHRMVSRPAGRQIREPSGAGRLIVFDLLGGQDVGEEDLRRAAPLGCGVPVTIWHV